jgi:HJR/Mrr/RecB family endonuclease
MSRKKKHKLNMLAFWTLIIVLILLVGGPKNPSDIFALVMIILAILLLVFSLLLLLPFWHEYTKLKRVDAITDSHMEALIRQQRMLIRTDAYGKPVTDKWVKELGYFVSAVIMPELTERQRKSLDKSETRNRVWQRVNNAVSQTLSNTALPISTPAEFEMYCAETLQRHGWTVERTPMAGDQGVDVIAQKCGMRIALQCKLYSNPVGNKAVQEIAAGRIHQQAHYGAVVTNSRYTSAAQELANTTGIWLLHFSDLPRLEAIAQERALEPGFLPFTS